LRRDVAIIRACALRFFALIPAHFALAAADAAALRSPGVILAARAVPPSLPASVVFMLFHADPNPLAILAPRIALALQHEIAASHWLHRLHRLHPAAGGASGRRGKQ